MKNLIFWIVLALALPSWGDDFLIKIPVPMKPQISQYTGGELEACVPTTILYMLKLGTPAMNQTYNKITGEDDEAKLATLTTLGKNSISLFTNRPMYNPIIGSYFIDTLQWVGLIFEKAGIELPPRRLEFISRSNEEVEFGVFVRRIHTQLVKTLSAKIPLIFDVTVMLTKDNKSATSHKHAVLVTGVQRQLRADELGFLITYINPFNGRENSAYMYEEINDPFNADILDPKAGMVWSDGKLSVKNSRGIAVSSPYLRLSAPAMFEDVRYEWGFEVDTFVTALFTFENVEEQEPVIHSLSQSR